MRAAALIAGPPVESCDKDLCICFIELYFISGKSCCRQNDWYKQPPPSPHGPPRNCSHLCFSECSVKLKVKCKKKKVENSIFKKRWCSTYMWDYMTWINPEPSENLGLYTWKPDSTFNIIFQQQLLRFRTWASLFWWSMYLGSFTTTRLNNFTTMTMQFYQSMTLQFHHCVTVLVLHNMTLLFQHNMKMQF